MTAEATSCVVAAVNVSKMKRIMHPKLYASLMKYSNETNSTSTYSADQLHEASYLFFGGTYDVDSSTAAAVVS
jgi:hypothetical protein